MKTQVTNLTVQMLDVAKQAPDALTAATVMIGAAVAILETKYGTKTAVSLISTMTDEALKGQQHGKT